MRIKYDSNNSGGAWWLTDEHWRTLEAAGWKVDWVSEQKDRLFIGSDGRYLGVLATNAEKEFDNPADAMREFEKLTGMDVMHEGCNCCGAPHCFEWDDGEKRHYASGIECARYLFPGAPETLREALEQRAKQDGDTV